MVSILPKKYRKPVLIKITFHINRNAPGSAIVLFCFFLSAGLGGFNHLSVAGS